MAQAVSRYCGLMAAIIPPILSMLTARPDLPSLRVGSGPVLEGAGAGFSAAGCGAATRAKAAEVPANAKGKPRLDLMRKLRRDVGKLCGVTGLIG